MLGLSLGDAFIFARICPGMVPTPTLSRFRF